MALELIVSSAKKKGTTFYTLHVHDDANPIQLSGETFAIEKDGEAWLENQGFYNAAWSNATSPDKNDNNPYTFGHKATFRVQRAATGEWSNEAEL